MYLDTKKKKMIKITQKGEKAIPQTVLRMLTGTRRAQINALNAFEKYEYGYLSGWDIKSTLYKGFFKKIVTGKTPFYVMGSFCTSHAICLNNGFWQSSFV